MAYNVYVIELDNEFAQTKKALEANPARDPMKPCVYVGYTSKSPKARIRQHMSGKPGKRGSRVHSSIVYRFGIRLLPDLYAKLNPIRTKEDAMEAEVLLARLLRTCGYTVWQN